MQRPQLVGTPLSHFTRKIRILFHELGVDYEFVRASSVLATSAAAYGDHPLRRVPTLIDGQDTVIESDHIARFVIQRHDPGDRFGVRSERVEDLNRLAVINGVMDNEVVLILAARGGLTNLDEVVYFRKLRAAIDSGLEWLNRHMRGEADCDYRDIALICMWQHLLYYQLVPDLDRHSHVAARVAQLAARPSVVATAPEVSLAEARAAGWQPG